ncbi:aspartate/glutamate racemase family protein [Labrys wisconsinensis]|uniref:Aspartate/glutamate racemase n=1 Tax=Labrys wisconsinensis TaxID=425677 RepID=A0ABU0JE94_9HYPH|nr:aspartate/glutamate racemase family protein [Labrys wisconsinensis]MDQ0471945.1 aspartate/glutamate racemase [Labrys wisconsinensis]
MTRIALIHAVQAAVQPIEDAFKAYWPEARRTNLLDDSLTRDREIAGDLTPELSQRMVGLASYVAGTGADGILFTCSAFGKGIEAAARALPIPVLKPNEAMFDAALDVGGRIGMLATFEPAVASMEEEFHELTRQRGSDATIETLVVPGARRALMANDLLEHDRLIANAAPALHHCSAIMLAHFSMASAEKAVAANSDRIVLSAPRSAIEKLKSALGQAHREELGDT